MLFIDTRLVEEHEWQEEEKGYGEFLVPAALLNGQSLVKIVGMETGARPFRPVIGRSHSGTGPGDLMPDPVTAYARAVATGRVLAGQWHRAACERHLRDLAEQRGLGLGGTGMRPAGSSSSPRHLKHTKGEWAGPAVRPRAVAAVHPGQPHGLEGTARRASAGSAPPTSRCPRGNGKTMLAAALGLWLAFLDGEAGAECYSIATKRDQAKLAWDAARWMVLASPALKRRLQVNAGHHRRTSPTRQQVPAARRGCGPARRAARLRRHRR